MSGTRPDDSAAWTELFVNGNRENSNNYLFDGIDNNTRLTLVTVLRPNVEAIQEFKVQTNLYSADQGEIPAGRSTSSPSPAATRCTASSTSSCATPSSTPTTSLPTAPARPNRRSSRISSGRHQRPDYREQDVLLRRLRRVPPGAGARVRQHRAHRQDAARGFQRSGPSTIR